jgi:hypothetical protein
MSVNVLNNKEHNKQIFTHERVQNERERVTDAA